MWPRNNGICSGRRPFSFKGMTANAPPPLASQLTERYSGLAYFRWWATLVPQIYVTFPSHWFPTLIKLVSHALRLICKLSWMICQRHVLFDRSVSDCPRASRLEGVAARLTIFRRAHKTASHPSSCNDTEGRRGSKLWKCRALKKCCGGKSKKNVVIQMVVGFC